jgi:mannonate dehydratase
MEFSRRKYLQGSVATLVGAGAGTALPASGKTTKNSNNKGCFYLTELLGEPRPAGAVVAPAGPPAGAPPAGNAPGGPGRGNMAGGGAPPSNNDLTICSQVGLKYVISNGGCRGRKEDYVANVAKQVAAYKEVGYKIAGVEGHPVAFENIKQGTEGRDQEIENTKWAIEALSKNGIDMICYNFMAGLGWTRTNQAVKERGGALTSEFDLEAAKAQGLTRAGEISEEKMWKNIEYFIKAVMPVADKFKVKMALHPDDPPINPLRGIARIIVSKRNYERIMAMYPSPYNGITYCQANFVLMKEDVYALAKEWCEKKKVFFIHYRDVEGDTKHFHETFHDNGPTDMIRMLEVYSKAGFVGPIRPDHAPALAGEAQNGRASGYTIGGKVLAFGYMKGIMDAAGLKYV